ncbi:regulator of nonsense transcripts 3B-like [Pollicipes pollicipes]|uniref:regulator of nonsense transcripts 3B-like n=1 Tax=Pollicipes pollicipes TaxID=41117 RepID=UPI0018859FDD|nr:regulator of nonsense transcripts 3B-like [Pollicipes pollicipes]
MAIKGRSHSENRFYTNSKDKNKHPPTKVVIRRLPPDMTLETFRDQVAPLPEHDHIRFVPADPGLAQHAFSRAYINFLHMDDIVTFRDRFDGYVFVDKQGFEFPGAENQVITPLVTFVCRRRAERKEERRRKEIERRKEETRKAKEKLSKEKREAREKGRHDTKESSKALWNDEQERKRDDGPAGKKHDDKHKEKHGKDAGRSDKEEKYRRRDKEERWKEGEKHKREDKIKQAKEERRKDKEWEDRKNKAEKHPHPSDTSSEASAAAGKLSAGDRRGGDGDVGRQGATAPTRDGAKPAPARDGSEPKRREPKADRRIKNKDRPSLTIYRPGMGKYSSKRLQERDSQSSSPPPAAAESADADEPQRRTLVFRRSRGAEP